MKNILKLKVTYVLLIFMNMGTLSGNGQVIISPTSAEPITRAPNSSLAAVKFPACTGIRVRINPGAINSPGVIEYVSGSVVKTAGIYFINTIYPSRERQVKSFCGQSLTYFNLPVKI